MKKLALILLTGIIVSCGASKKKDVVNKRDKPYILIAAYKDRGSILIGEVLFNPQSGIKTDTTTGEQTIVKDTAFAYWANVNRKTPAGKDTTIEAWILLSKDSVSVVSWDSIQVVYKKLRN